MITTVTLATRPDGKSQIATSNKSSPLEESNLAAVQSAEALDMLREDLQTGTVLLDGCGCHLHVELLAKRRGYEHRSKRVEANHFHRCIRAFEASASDVVDDIRDLTFELASIWTRGNRRRRVCC